MVVGYAEVVGNVQVQEDSLKFVRGVVEDYLLEGVIHLGDLLGVVQPYTHKEHIAACESFTLVATVYMLCAVDDVAYGVA